MKYMINFCFIVLALSILTSCLPEDEAVVLPPAGDQVIDSIYYGFEFENQFFMDLNQKTKQYSDRRNYDLLFYTKADDYLIRLNTGNNMFCWNAFGHQWEEINETTINRIPPFDWQTDRHTLALDSMGIGLWLDTTTTTSLNHLYIIDRGKSEFTSPKDRYRMLQIISVNDKEYKIRLGTLDHTLDTVHTITKDTSRSYSYFTFHQEGKQLFDVEPPKEKWDLLFSRYIHIYDSEPFDSPFRYYSVAGILSNHLNGVEVAEIDTNLQNYISYEQYQRSDIFNTEFKSSYDEIGYDWKYFDQESGYSVNQTKYFIIKDREGFYYKFRVFDYFDQNGDRGTPKFEYQLL